MRGSARRLLMVALAAASVVSCGDRDETTAPGPGGNGDGNGDGVRITGRERLAWAQRAPDRAALASYQFVVFVDDARVGLGDARCADQPGANGYECSANLPSMTPGRHVLELATIGGNGQQSGRAGPLVVNLSTSGQLTFSASSPLTLLPAAAPDSDVPATACLASSPDTCFDVSVVVEGLAAPGHVAALPPDRAIFIDAERRAALVDFNTGAVETVLTAGGPEGRLVGLAVDPAFADNGYVYVGAVSGPNRLSIVRLREVANRLGEAATLVADLPVAPDADPAIAIDGQRRLLVAMPTPVGAQRSRREPYDGFVLRFTEQGAAAGTRVAGSPVFASGPARPSALALDAAGRVWVAAADAPDGSLTVLTDMPGASSSGAAVPIAIDARAWPFGTQGLDAIAFAAPGSAGAGGQRIFVAGGTPGTLWTGTLADGAARSLTLEPLPLGAGDMRAVAVTGSGELLVAVDTKLLRLRPRRATDR